MATTAFGRRRVAKNKTAAFTILEVMIAAGILAVALGSVFALNSQVTSSIRRGVSGSFASQLIQERMEQFRRAAWTELTSNYPPETDDVDDAGYDSDPPDDGDPVYEDDPGTAFNYELSDLDSTTPGLQDLLAIPTGSAAQLPNVVETVRVETYNPSADALTSWEPDDTQPEGYREITIDSKKSGGTPIVVERKNGIVTVKSKNNLVVLNNTVRLTMTVAWTGTDNVTRTKEIVTLFTVEGDK